MELGVSRSELARCCGLDVGYLRRIELGLAHPSLDALVAIAVCLGMDLGIRLFPVAGPRIHDRLQAPMIESLIRYSGREWSGQPEVLVRAARGVIDLVLRRRADGVAVACECHSEIRRLEAVLRRLGEKREALRGLEPEASVVSGLLLLRSTTETRAIARSYEATLTAAFPARTRDALAALRGDAPWPGAAILWARVSRGRAEILDRVPRGVGVGR